MRRFTRLTNAFSKKRESHSTRGYVIAAANGLVSSQ